MKRYRKCLLGAPKYKSRGPLTRWKCAGSRTAGLAGLRRASRFLAVIYVATSVGGLAGTASASGRLDLNVTDWSVFTPPGKQPALFHDGDAGAVEVRADSAVSFLYRALPEGMQDVSRVSWRWRVDYAPPATDLSDAGMDDRPLAVHFWFGKSDRDRTFWDSVKGTFGQPVFHHVITYVYGGRQARGAMIANPHLPQSVLITLRGQEAGNGVWFDETVNPRADFQRAFGTPPPAAPMYVAISTDTDDGGGIALGHVADLNLEMSDHDRVN